MLAQKETAALDATLRSGISDSIAVRSPVIPPEAWADGYAIWLLQAEQSGPSPFVVSPRKDALLLGVHLSGEPARYLVRSDAESTSCKTIQGDSVLFDLGTGPVLTFDGTTRALYVGFERRTMEAAAHRAGIGSSEAIQRLKNQTGVTRQDPIIQQLSASIIATLGWDDCCARSFRTQLVTAIAMHVLGSRESLPLVRGPLFAGLAPWQVRRAKDLIGQRLDAAPRLEHVAQACGLSRSHFARAFRQSLGLPPHAWLTRQRVARAKTLLRTTDMPLSTIAIECGFSDQSHFTRVFSRQVSLSPGKWRRIAGPPAAGPLPLDQTMTIG